jgi:hypothetical protein
MVVYRYYERALSAFLNSSNPTQFGWEHKEITDYARSQYIREVSKEKKM